MPVLDPMFSLPIADGPHASTFCTVRCAPFRGGCAPEPNHATMRFSASDDESLDVALVIAGSVCKLRDSACQAVRDH